MNDTDHETGVAVEVILDEDHLYVERLPGDSVTLIAYGNDCTLGMLADAVGQALQGGYTEQVDHYHDTDWGRWVLILGAGEKAT